MASVRLPGTLAHRRPTGAFPAFDDRLGPGLPARENGRPDLVLPSLEAHLGEHLEVRWLASPCLLDAGRFVDEHATLRAVATDDAYGPRWRAEIRATDAVLAPMLGDEPPPAGDFLDHIDVRPEVVAPRAGSRAASASPPRWRARRGSRRPAAVAARAARSPASTTTQRSAS